MFSKFSVISLLLQNNCCCCLCCLNQNSDNHSWYCFFLLVKSLEIIIIISYFTINLMNYKNIRPVDSFKFILIKILKFQELMQSLAM